jgi:hypothetical protein
MFVTDHDIRKLASMREYDDRGVHFTELYSESWLDRMEDAGLIQVWRPMERFSLVSTSEWRLRLTQDGMRILPS